MAPWAAELALMVSLGCYALTLYFTALPAVVRYLWIMPLVWPSLRLWVRLAGAVFLLVAAVYVAAQQPTLDHTLEAALVPMFTLAGLVLGRRHTAASEAEQRLASLLAETPVWTQDLSGRSIEQVSREAILRRRRELKSQLDETLYGLLQSCSTLAHSLTAALLWRRDDGYYGVREVFTDSDHFAYGHVAVRGDGMLGWVLEHGRVWLSSELTGTLDSPMYDRDEGIRSVLVVPIEREGATVGMLYVDSRNVQHFQPDVHPAMLEVFARLILDHMRFHDLAQTYDLEKTRVEAFFLAAGALLEPASLQALSGRIFEMLQSIVPVDGALLVLRQDESYKVSAFHGAAWSRLLGLTIEPDSLIDWVINHLQGVYATNLDSVVRPVLGRDHGTSAVQSVMIIPLQVAQESSGAIVLLSHQKDRFSPHEIMIFENLKKIIAVSIQQRRSFSNIRTLASTDPLTKLLNRRFFFEKFEKEIRRLLRSTASGASGAFIMMDIDHFKSVNDSHGHSVGDDVLVAVSECLRTMTREHDIAGRFGGEEFAVFCPDIDVKAARKLCERLRKRISELSFQGSMGAFSVTASFGIAMLPAHANDSQTLVQAADAALYEAKRGGRNRVVVASVQPSPELGTISGSLG